MDLERLPLAPVACALWARRRERGWDLIARSELGEQGLAEVLPLLAHRFEAAAPLRALSPDERRVLRRLLPRLRTFERRGDGGLDLVFDGDRPAALHVLARVLEVDARLALEDVAAFAAQGAMLVRALEALKSRRTLSAEAALYAPLTDAPFPFKLLLVEPAQGSHRAVYLGLLRALIQRGERDEEFRERHMRQLAHGFAKFGPAAATPEFQQVELSLWGLLGGLAARLRILSGRVLDSRDGPTQHELLRELERVHEGLSAILNLPGRMASAFAARLDRPLAELAPQAREELAAIARRVDLDAQARAQGIDEVAALVHDIRALGSAAPLALLLEKDARLRRACGEPLLASPGRVRTYQARIATGAEVFDERRFDESSGEWEEEELDLGELGSDGRFVTRRTQSLRSRLDESAEEDEEP